MTKLPVCAVGAIVLDHGQILLVKRDREPGRGQWSLPGGRVNLGETLREAIVREVREETGIDIEVEALCGIAERIVRDDGGEIAYHYIVVDFYAGPRSQRLRAGDDAADARWVPVAEVKDLHLTPGLLEFLGDRGILEGRRPRP